MPLIEWKDEYSVGVPDVDEEHRGLIELINELYDTARAGERGAEISEFLGEIYVRIASHFALEELLMRERQYDEYEDHKSDHEKLLEEIRDIMDEYDDGKLLDADALTRRLDAWFSEHFRTKDSRLHRRLG